MTAISLLGLAVFAVPHGNLHWDGLRDQSSTRVIQGHCRSLDCGSEGRCPRLRRQAFGQRRQGRSLIRLPTESLGPGTCPQRSSGARRFPRTNHIPGTWAIEIPHSSTRMAITPGSIRLFVNPRSQEN